MNTLKKILDFWAKGVIVMFAGTIGTLIFCLIVFLTDPREGLAKFTIISFLVEEKMASHIEKLEPAHKSTEFKITLPKAKENFENGASKKECSPKFKGESL